MYSVRLKVWGYVFWDGDRLRKAGVFDRNHYLLDYWAERFFGYENLYQYDERGRMFRGGEDEYSDGTESE